MATDSRQVDPVAFCKYLWPDVELYDRQREILYSGQDNDETVVAAGNALGKDFVAAITVLWFFLTRHPCRIVTTSAKERHLNVLWGEIGRFIQTCAYPLDARKGGPLIVKQRELRKVVDGEEDRFSYVLGMVAAPDKVAAMQGHHVARKDGLPRTLFVADECSGIPNSYYLMARTWFHRMLAIGNPWPCENFFKRAILGQSGTNDKGGDILAPDGKRYWRKVFKLSVEHSPNIRLARLETAAGREPSGRIIVPGVKTWEEYQKNRELWDPFEQKVSLDGEFYEGPQRLLYPPEWLDRAALLAEKLQGSRRNPTHIGVDPGEGSAETAMIAVDKLGVVDLDARKTPDTAEIPDRIITFAKQHSVKPQNILIDRGGGGRQIADSLKRRGWKIRTIGFGDSATLEKTRGLKTFDARQRGDETRSIYKLRRSEMYGLLRIALDPTADGEGFAIPAEYTELRRQLSPVPLIWDGEGQMVLPPKRGSARRRLKMTYQDTDANDDMTMEKLLGCSPDQSDALVLAVFGLSGRAARITVGRAF